MSYIPDHLTLKNGIAQSDFIQSSNNDLTITTAGVLKIAGGSGVEASVLLSVAGTDPDDNPIRYSFPDVNIAMPAQDQIISFNSDGTSQFINGGGGGNPNAFINSQAPTVPFAGAVLYADGDNAVNARGSNNTFLSSEGIRLYGAGLQLASVVGCDSRITQDDNCDLFLNNNSNGNIKLRCGGVLQLNGSAGGSYSLPNVNTAVPAQDQIISFNSNGTSQFINNGGGGNPNAFINSQPSTVPPANSILIADGDNAFNSRPSTVEIVSTPSINALSFTPLSNPDVSATLGYSADALILDNLDNTINRDNFISIAQNIVLTTTNSAITGNIELSAGAGVIQCNSGINIADGAGSSSNNIYKDGDGDLLINNPNGAIGLKSDKGVYIIDVVNNFETQLLTDNIGDFSIDNTSGNIGLNTVGTVNINKASDPQLNFNNADYPTQQCNIAFESATQELIIEHHSPDLASKCNIRLGTNDINIQSTFGPLQSGNINLISQNGYTFINQYKLPNINPTADGQLLSCDIDGTSSWIDVPPATIAQNTYTYWVSTVGGSDSNNGSIINPFLTIQYAIGVANALADTIPVVINVLAGVYTENLSIIRNNLAIQGANPTSPNLTYINGTVSYNVVSSDPVNFPQVSSLSNFLITNTVSHENGTIYQNSLILNNCILLPLSNVAPLSTTNTGLGVLKADETLNNSFVYIFATPITINSTNLTIANSQILNSPFFSSTTSFVNVIGSGKVSGLGAIFRNSNVSAQVSPLVVIANSIDSTGDSTFNTCSFIYNSSILDTGFGGKCGIRFNNSGSCQTYIVTNCFFKCLGATTTTGSANQFLIIQRTGAGQCSLALGNNPCQGTNTHHVPPSGSGFTKIILTNAV